MPPLLCRKHMKFDDPIAGIADIEFRGPAGRTGPPPTECALLQLGKREHCITEVAIIF